MSKKHHTNPVASLSLHRIYGVPVLFSGLAPLVLSSEEINLIEKHYRETLRQLLKLHKNTPRTVVYFLSGSLPGSALLHLRQLSLFGMICRLKGSLLHRYAYDRIMSGTVPRSSWFSQIRKWCVMYGLPHPMDLIESPLSKDQFKTIVKKKIISYWEILLREEASCLPSLKFFRPHFMSLSRPHPILSSAGSSPAKVCKATVQSWFLSRRYRTESLLKHWSSNKGGCCLLSSDCQDVIEDVEHVLQFCPALEVTRKNLLEFNEVFIKKLELPDIGILIRQLCSTFVNSLLTVLPYLKLLYLLSTMAL